MANIEQAIREVHGSLILEGLVPDDFTRNLEAEIAAGRLSVTEAIARVKEHYSALAAQRRRDG